VKLYGEFEEYRPSMSESLYLPLAKGNAARAKESGMVPRCVLRAVARLSKNITRKLLISALL
jgi:hypothetical protein